MKAFFDNAAHAFITAVSAILIILIVLFSNTIRQIEISVGEVSDADIYAPRAIVDETTTNALRQAARDSVEKVYVNNEDKRTAAVNTVNSIFASASSIRSEQKTEENSDISADGAKLSATVKIDLSQESANALISASDEKFAQMRYCADILNEVMTKGVSNVNNSLKECETSVKELPLSAKQAKACVEIISSVITENVEYDAEETRRRKDAAANAVSAIEYKKNQIILRKGEVASQAQLDMLEALGIIKGSSPIKTTYIAGIILFFILSILSLICYSSYKKRKRSCAMPVISLMALVTILIVFYGNGYIPSKYWGLLPVGIFACVVTIFTTPQTAIFSNALVAGLCGIVLDADWGFSVSMTLAGTLCGFGFGMVKRRSQMLPASIICALSFGAVSSSITLIEASGIKAAMTAFGFSFAGGIFSGILTTGLLPFLELILNATTPMKLTELANPENKLLKKLLIEAPGTYHHSLTVANISEIAAREIGANSLLARVGAYYHDVGKLRKPLYFKENQYDSNIHDMLTPEESSQIIINHVTDGAEIAAKHHLPKDICDIISQHHGTTTTGYFLIRAKEKNKDADESLFTYPGPIPETKEAAIVMLADSCEAAVRSITDKNEEKIEAMVRRIVTERVNSGQFSRCNLTFAELEKIVKTIIKTLGGYFHERIKYE